MLRKKNALAHRNLRQVQSCYLVDLTIGSQRPIWPQPAPGCQFRNYFIDTLLRQMDDLKCELLKIKNKHTQIFVNVYNVRLSFSCAVLTVFAVFLLFVIVDIPFLIAFLGGSK